MPSTTSSSVSMAFASSTVMTPSLPTFCIALAIILPISLSPLAEIVPTWAISSLVETLRERDWTSLTTAPTAMSMPRFRSIGFIPAATALEPVTPSLVMRGAPNDLSMTTLRPLGPSVTRTALARVSTPRNMRSRASVENLTSLAAIVGYSLLLARFVDDAHHVGFLHDDELFAVQLDFRARPFAEQDAIALLDVERMKRAVLAARPGPDGDDLAFHRLFLGGVGDDDAAGGPVGLLDAADEHTVVQWSKRHE